MGDGNADMKTYVERFGQLCPDAPLQLEIISGFSKNFDYLNADFWNGYEDIRGPEFASFIKLAKSGKAMAPFKPADGTDKDKANQDYQKAQLERSIRYCKETLKIGRKA